MEKFLRIAAAVLAAVFASACFSLFGCSAGKQYKLTVYGGEYLFEDLKDAYKSGETVEVKVRIKPYEGVRVLLDSKPLVKTKSGQEEFWQFSFEMPSREAALDIQSYKGFDEPILYGFYITFNDKNGDGIEQFNKPADSEEAIADYAVIYYEDDHKVYTNNTGANVFADSKEKISNVGYELEDTLYFTYELIDAVACVDWLYIDEETMQIYSHGGAGYRLDDVGSFSAFNRQNLSDMRYTGQMKEYEEKFDSSVKINFKYIDYLTGVRVLEYGADNVLIKSTEIKNAESVTDYFASELCEYVIIEEEYTAKKEKNNCEIYCERSLINKSKLGGGKTLKYPRGNGLILPVYLFVNWAETDF